MDSAGNDAESAGVPDTEPDDAGATKNTGVQDATSATLDDGEPPTAPHQRC